MVNKITQQHVQQQVAITHSYTYTKDITQVYKEYTIYK